MTTPGTPTRTGDSFLTRFLKERNLSEPSGQPLYRYHARSEELAEIRAILPAAMSFPRPGSVTAMLFCLWASEWWRRTYVGGPWKWETLLRALGHSDFAPGGGRYRDLQDLVIRGLRGWRRSVLTVGESRGFLVTLACEGGLPLNLILRQQTHLRAYLRGVLEEFKLFGGAEPPRDLAERVRNRLPKGLRQEVVYELSGSLIQKIWRYQRELGETRTPVQDLDRIHAGWRDELPVRVTDEIARTLLNNLLLDAAEVARGGRIKVRWNVSLIPVSEEEWGLEGAFHFPTTLNAEDFNVLFGCAADEAVPTRFDLSVQIEGEPLRVLAIATERHDRAGVRYLGLELMPAAMETNIRHVTHPRRVIARTRSEALTTDLFPGATGLMDLPWVFVPEDAEKQTRQTCRFAGEGSVKLRERWALVAVPPGELIEKSGEARAELVGVLGDEHRLVYRILGRVTFKADDGSRTVVETQARTDSTKIEFRPEGRERNVGRAGTRVFMGRPSLVERRDGGYPDTVPMEHLWWKPDGPEGSWGTYGSDAVGFGQLRYMEHGIVRHSTRIRILPEQAEIEIRPSSNPRQGEFRFVGFDGARVSLRQPKLVTSSVREDADAVAMALTAVGAPPNDVTVVFDWGESGRLEISLPFPSNRADFFLPAGRRLPPEGKIAVGSLSGIRVEVIVPRRADFELHGRYRGKGALGVAPHHRAFTREIPEIGLGHYSIDLALIQPVVEECLSLGDDPDASVTLLVHCNRYPLAPRRVFVKRFDLQLERCDGDMPLLGLDDEARLQVNPEDLDDLVLEALSLLEPEEEPIPLEPHGRGRWRIPEEGMDHGPYLILGRQGDWQRVRPMRWYHIDQGRCLGPEVHRPETLSEAYASGFRSTDVEAPFLSVARQLARDPAHIDWPIVFAYLQHTSLPIQVFPLLRAMAHIPASCVMGAVIASSVDFELLWERMESPAFAWWQIPLIAWSEAFEAYVDHRRHLYAAVNDPDTARRYLKEQFDARLDRVTENLRGLQPAFGFLRAQLMGTPVSAQASGIVNPDLQRVLREQYLDHRSSCPALSMSQGAITFIPELSSRVRRLAASLPWSESVFVKRVGRFEVQERADYADLPALTAVLVMAGIRSGRSLGWRIRQVRDQDPEWFDEALRLAQLIAYGNMKSGNTEGGTDG